MVNKAGFTPGIFAAACGLVIALLGSGCDNRGEKSKEPRRSVSQSRSEVLKATGSGKSVERQARAVKVAEKFRKEAAERKEPAAKKKPASSVKAKKPVERILDPADSPALRSADRLLKILEATEKAAGRLQEEDSSETEDSTEAAGEAGQVNFPCPIPGRFPAGQVNFPCLIPEFLPAGQVNSDT